MPTPTTGTKTGNTGNGYVKITSISVVISAPTNLVLYNITSTSATISWQTVTTATSYKIYSNGNLLGTTSSLSYPIIALSTGTTYSINVTAINASRESLSSLPLMLIAQKSLAEIQITAGTTQKVQLLLVSPDGLYYYDQKTNSAIELTATPVTDQYDLSIAGKSLITFKHS